MKMMTATLQGTSTGRPPNGKFGKSLTQEVPAIVGDMDSFPGGYSSFKSYVLEILKHLKRF